MLYLSPQILADIQLDEEIQQLLGDEFPLHGRLVRVAAENVERLTALLRTRGFEVQ